MSARVNVSDMHVLFRIRQTGGSTFGELCTDLAPYDPGRKVFEEIRRALARLAKAEDIFLARGDRYMPAEKWVGECALERERAKAYAAAHA